MAGPWEDYKPQAPGQEDGPWADFQPPAAPREQNSISAKPSGAAQWLRDLEGDVRYGGTTTLPGRILKKMGAQGLNVGSQGNADTVLQSTPLGPIHVAQGIAEKRPLHAAKGVLETAELPLEFVGGPVAHETAGALEKGASLVGKGIEKFRAPAKAVKAAEQGVGLAKTASAADVGAVRQGAAKTVAHADKALSATKVKSARAAEEAAKAAIESLPTRMREHTITTLRSTARKSGLEDLKTNTVRDSVPELAAAFEGRAKTAYKSVDEALGGQFQPLLDEIRDVKHAIGANKVLDPMKAKQLTEHLVELRKQKVDAIKKATAAGVENADELIRVADTDYARFKALEKVHKKFKSATGVVKHGGEPNSERFATVVDELNNNGVLKFALGEDEAARLVKLTSEHLAKTKQAKAARGAAAKAEREIATQSGARESAAREAERAVEKAEREAEKRVQEAMDALTGAKETLSKRNSTLIKLGATGLGGGMVYSKGKEAKNALFGE
jgi:hypothetical protein